MRAIACRAPIHWPHGSVGRSGPSRPTTARNPARSQNDQPSQTLTHLHTHAQTVPQCASSVQSPCHSLRPRAPNRPAGRGQAKTDSDMTSAPSNPAADQCEPTRHALRRIPLGKIQTARRASNWRRRCLFLHTFCHFKHTFKNGQFRLRV